MSLVPVFHSIFVMGVTVMIGAFMSYKLQIHSDARKLLVSFIINVAMPCIILNGLFHVKMTNQLLLTILAVFVLSIFINCLGLLLGWTISKVLGFESVKAKQAAVLAGLGNTGFIGVPLCHSLFGPIGGLLGAVFDAGMDFILFTVAVFLLQDHPSFSFRQLKSLINLPLCSIFIGITSVAIGFQPPDILKELTSSLANIAAPLAMLYIGMMIPPIFKQQYKVQILQIGTPLIVKLLILPFMVTVFLMVVELSNSIKQIILIQASMPTLTLASVMFAKYAKEEEWAALATITSTIVAMATIPFIIFIGKFI